jgi:hypothetical protein
MRLTDPNLRRAKRKSMGHGQAEIMWFGHVAGNWCDYRFEELFSMMSRLQPAIRAPLTAPSGTPTLPDASKSPRLRLCVEHLQFEYGRCAVLRIIALGGDHQQAELIGRCRRKLDLP